MIYSNDFESLKTIFNDIRGQGFLSEKGNHSWRVFITDNNEFYKKINSSDQYNNMIASNDIISKAQKLSYATGYNYQIYYDYIKSDSQKYNNYFLNYTSSTEYCNKEDNTCTVLFGIN